jgi:hypothetical protein
MLGVPSRGFLYKSAGPIDAAKILAALLVCCDENANIAA